MLSSCSSLAYLAGGFSVLSFAAWALVNGSIVWKFKWKNYRGSKNEKLNSGQPQSQSKLDNA